MEKGLTAKPKPSLKVPTSQKQASSWVVWVDLLSIDVANAKSYETYEEEDGSQAAPPTFVAAAGRIGPSQALTALTGSITQFWVEQKPNVIVTLVKIMKRFCPQQNPNKMREQTRVSVNEASHGLLK